VRWPRCPAHITVHVESGSNQTFQRTAWVAEHGAVDDLPCIHDLPDDTAFTSRIHQHRAVKPTATHEERTPRRRGGIAPDHDRIVWLAATEDLDVLIVLIRPEPGGHVTGYRFTENRAGRGLRLQFRVLP
jgi:hypothetical protein